jgi:uncharacterized protein YwqG
MTWPSKNGAPLTFLACLDLQSLSTALPLAWLPTSGRLLFFYDVVMSRQTQRVGRYAMTVAKTALGGKELVAILRRASGR